MANDTIQQPFDSQSSVALPDSSEMGLNSAPTVRLVRETAALQASTQQPPAPQAADPRWQSPALGEGDVPPRQVPVHSQLGQLYPQPLPTYARQHSGYTGYQHAMPAQSAHQIDNRYDGHVQDPAYISQAQAYRPLHAYDVPWAPRPSALALRGRTVGWLGWLVVIAVLLLHDVVPTSGMGTSVTGTWVGPGAISGQSGKHYRPFARARNHPMDTRCCQARGHRGVGRLRSRVARRHGQAPWKNS